MHARCPRTIAVAGALLLAAVPGRAQEARKLLDAAKHTLAKAVEAALAETKTGTVVHAELEQDGARTVFSIDVAQGRSNTNVLLDAATLRVLGTEVEADDHSRIVAAAKVSLASAIAVAEPATKGRAVDAELIWQQEQPVFRVRLFASEDQVVVVDAVSGKVRGAPDAPSTASPGPATPALSGPRFTDTFPLQPGELVSRGSNAFFVLEPGFTLVLAGTDEGKAVELTVTVLDATRVVDGTETRVVEERETKDGQLAEVSRNFFAISRRTASVYYFGEEVDVYRNGEVVSHDGAWLSGQNGARFGLLMPGTPLLGSRYHQEIAPQVAMDRAEIVSLDDTVECAAGTFRGCLRTVETTPLEPADRASKVYAPGIGLVTDGPLRLVKHGSAR